MAHPGGRPKIKTIDFKEGWQEAILTEMRMGASREEIYGMLNIGEKTFARLMREDEEFTRTIKEGERLSRAWWLNVGRTQMRNKDFSATLWYMNMKNRFGWADKKEIKQEVSGELAIGSPDPEKAAKYLEFLKSQS